MCKHLPTAKLILTFPPAISQKNKSEQRLFEEGLEKSTIGRISGFINA